MPCAAVPHAFSTTLADAAVVAATRGRLMQALPLGGAMVAIEAAELEIAAYLGGLEGRVAIAAFDGRVRRPGTCHGTRLALKSRGRSTRHLRVSHAFHSSKTSFGGELPLVERLHRWRWKDVHRHLATTPVGGITVGGRDRTVQTSPRC